MWQQVLAHMRVELLCHVAFEVPRVGHEVQDLLNIVGDQTLVSFDLDNFGYLNVFLELFE